MDSTSSKLLQQLRDDDTAQSAWSKLVEIYQPFLRSQLRRIDSRLPADDIVQDVLLRVVKAIPHFEHNSHRGAFRAWLTTIVRHRVHEVWRERQRQAVARATSKVLDELADDASTASQRFDRELNAHLLREIVRNEFGERDYAIFVEYGLEQQDSAEVAKKHGVSVSLLYQIYRRVKVWLLKEGPGLLGDTP